MFDDRRRVLAWYRAIYVACIVVLSVQTMLVATSVTDHHFWLAALEIVGAILLLVRRAQLAGLVVLLVVYAIAATHELLRGHSVVSLVLFAASAAAIVLLDGLAPPPVV